VRKELFCDGRVNCAWPYSEPAGIGSDPHLPPPSESSPPFSLQKDFFATFRLVTGFQ
jgi:hypothetical protein